VTCAVLVADPPWKHKDQLPGKGRGAEKHYKCMPTDEICKMWTPIESEKHAVLFLWRVASMVEDACRVARAWGFVPKAEIEWRKLTRNGNPFFGMGRYVRYSHEICMICTRGSAMPAVHDQRSYFEAKVGRHSEKPDEFYSIVQRLYPESTWFEVFARKPRVQWKQFGLEFGQGAA